MPVTPKFQIDQNETHIILKISAVYARLDSAEAYVDEQSFLFSASPYFLRLYFKQKLVTNDDPRCSYNSDNNTYCFEVEKATAGEQFTGLNSIGSLLSNPEAKSTEFVGISVINGDDDASGSEQTEDSTSPISSLPNIYGNIKSLFFNEVHTLFQIKSLETSRDERLRLSDDICRVDFDENHYYSDLCGYEDEDMHTVTGLPPMENLLNAKLPESRLSTEFSSLEFEQIQQLPRRKPMLTKSDKMICTAQFLEILYGVCYVHRSLEFNTEDLEMEPASFTVRRISRALSWLVVAPEITDTVHSLTLRTLSYSLRRNFELSRRVFEDAVEILRKGVVPVVRCMLEAVKWCNYSEAKIVSDCFIVPVLLWIQGRENCWLGRLADRVEKVEISVEDLGLEIENLDTDSSDEEMDYDDMLKQIESYKKFLTEQESTKNPQQPTRLIQELDDLGIS